jgi:ubiquitin-protein ligase
MSSLPKRFPKEIQDATSSQMRASGIYYWYDETDMSKGRAMILGPEGTPYAFCPLMFSFQFPADYPFSSPTVTFLTSDATTRFHPNLYVTGKVCLSILGTWKGPGWSPALTVSKVLLSIQSLLDANPIVNEPSYENTPITDPNAAAYAAFVTERLTALTYPALLQLKAGNCPLIWKEFKDVLDVIGDDLIRRQRAKIAAHTEDKEYTVLPYSMRGFTRWSSLRAL